eukprot:gene3920-2788_t
MHRDATIFGVVVTVLTFAPSWLVFCGFILLFDYIYSSRSLDLLLDLRGGANPAEHTHTHPPHFVFDAIHTIQCHAMCMHYTPVLIPPPLKQRQPIIETKGIREEPELMISSIPFCTYVYLLQWIYIQRIFNQKRERNNARLCLLRKT